MHVTGEELACAQPVFRAPVVICVSPAFKDEDASVQPTPRNVGIHEQPVFKMADRM